MCVCDWVCMRFQLAVSPFDFVRYLFNIRRKTDNNSNKFKLLQPNTSATKLHQKLERIANYGLGTYVLHATDFSWMEIEWVLRCIQCLLNFLFFPVIRFHFDFIFFFGSCLFLAMPDCMFRVLVLAYLAIIDRLDGDDLHQLRKIIVYKLI